MMFLATWGFSQNAPIDFEPGGFGDTWTWATFQAPMGSSNPTFSVVANPNTSGINSSSNVAKLDISYGTAANWGEAGCESMRGADLGVFQFDSTNAAVKVMVYQESFAAPVALKFSDAAGAALPEVVVQNTVADQWVEITFDMSGWIPVPFNNPEQIIFFPSYAPRAGGHIVYFDNVTFNPVGTAPPIPDPMTSAPAPTRPQTEVLSVYTDVYPDSTVQNFNFNAFAGAVTVSQVDIQMDGNMTGKLENIDFYGAQWDAEDVSGYDFVHIDYYATTSTAFNFYLIDQTAMIPGGNPEEPRYAFATTGGDETLVPGQWNSVDIPLSHFTNFPTPNFSYDLNDIFQWKFDGNGTVYFDNIYFYRDTTTGVMDPMTSAPDPTIDEAEVLSVYSNYYTDSTVLNFNFNAFQGAVTVSEVDIENDGNLTGKLENIDFYGAQWDAEDVSGYNFVHLDYYATTSTAFNFYLIDQTAMIPGGNPEEPRYAIADMGGDETLVTGQWVSVFIPLTHFTSFPTPNFSYDLNDIFQWKFDGNGTVYFDNVYFVKDTTTTAGVPDPMTSAPDPTIDESRVLSVYSNYYTDSTVLNFNLNAFQGAVTVSEVDIEMDGNMTGKLENLDFYGAQWDAEDVSGYDYVHLDYYATTSTAFNFYLIDETAMIPGGNPEEPRFSIALAGGDSMLVQGQWKSVFIPLQHFLDHPTPNFSYDLNDIFQYKFDGNGTVYFDNIYFVKDMASSIDGLSANAVRVYPNPTKDTWNLQVEGNSITSVEVFDVTGKNVLSIEGNHTNEIAINSTALKSGLYIARITTPAGIATKKLIKE